MPLAVTAQKLQATAPPRAYRVGSEKAFLYRMPADTSNKKSSFFLYPDAEAIVVGAFSSHWAIIKREGFLYLVRSKSLANYEASAVPTRALLSSLPIDPETKLITYQGVVEVSSVNKADLYVRALSWVAMAYKSANSVIQMQDKEAGQIIVKGVINASGMGDYTGVVRHTLSIYIKDGKYKYVLTNFTHDAAGASGVVSGGALEQPIARIGGFGSGIKSEVEWPYIQVHTSIEARNLISELEASMTLKGKKDPSDF